VRWRQRWGIGLVAVFLSALVLGCSPQGPAFQSQDSPGASIQVVTTFSLLKDLVDHVGGDKVEVYSMVPQGTDPHDYQPLPEDIEAATQADVLVWNGLGMETGGGWFAGLVDVAGKELGYSQVIEASRGVRPLTLGSDEEPNPHAFLSPRAGEKYVENIAVGLGKVDPPNRDYYLNRAQEFTADIRELDKRYEAELAAVQSPVLVTSERAFQYVAHHYGLTEGYLWLIDSDEQATPEQVIDLIEFIDKHKPRGLLIETNVDPRPMEVVSEESGVPVVGEVYSDELGPPGSPAATYIDYLEYNLEAYINAGGRS